MRKFAAFYKFHHYAAASHQQPEHCMKHAISPLTCRQDGALGGHVLNPRRSILFNPQKTAVIRSACTFAAIARTMEGSMPKMPSRSLNGAIRLQKKDEVFTLCHQDMAAAASQHVFLNTANPMAVTT